MLALQRGYDACTTWAWDDLPDDQVAGRLLWLTEHNSGRARFQNPNQDSRLPMSAIVDVTTHLEASTFWKRQVELFERQSAAVGCAAATAAVTWQRCEQGTAATLSVMRRPSEHDSRQRQGDDRPLWENRVVTLQALFRSCLLLFQSFLPVEGTTLFR